MFGRLALRDYYPQLTQPERDEREEFCVDACYRMRDRFLGEEVWSTLGLPREVADYVNHSDVRRALAGSAGSEAPTVRSRASNSHTATILGTRCQHRFASR